MCDDSLNKKTCVRAIVKSNPSAHYYGGNGLATLTTII